jgi:phospholipid-binding lipoprotein MlaA
MNCKSDRSKRCHGVSKLPALCGLLIGGLLLGACATGPHTAIKGDDPSQAPDPFEPFNRTMQHVNDGFETVIAKPLDVGYRTVTPRFLRKGLSNAYANVISPITFLNDVLQGKPERASQTLARFVMNSTVGLGGLIDVASAKGIKRHEEDFGQTLAVWGVKSGPYLVLPLIGPTTIRDGIGYGVDTFSDPLYWLIHDNTVSYALYGSELLIDYDDHRDDLDNLRKSSIDFYSALRSAYLQNRASEIRDGAPATGDSAPDILDTLPESEPPAK